MLNVELLERVKKHILEEPKRLDMESWIDSFPENQGGPKCGTAGCIAGWTVLLVDGMDAAHKPVNIASRAQDLLGLPKAWDGLSEAARSLFYVERWPHEARHEYWQATRAGNIKMIAETTAKRIDLFIREQKQAVQELYNELKGENQSGT